MGGINFPIMGGTPSFVSPQTTSSSNNSTSESSLSDQLVKQVLQNIVPFQGDMSQIIQNKPQLTLPTPVRPHPAQSSGPIGNVQATTAAGQQRNDIGNLISSIGNIVKAGVNKKREKEDRDLMYDLAIIQGAASNPNDPHNKQLLDAIASDPKKVKRLQKAIGFNPLSGEAPSPETQALMKGAATLQQQKQQKTQQLQQIIAQRLGPQAAQQNGQQDAMSSLMNRMPNTPQLNPTVALQGELIKAGILPKADTSLQSLVSLTKDVMTNEAKYAELKNKAEISNNQLLMKYIESIDAAKAKLDLEKVKQEGATERSKIRAKATTTAASITAGSRVESAKVRSNSAIDRYKAKHTVEEGKLLDKAIKNIDQDIKNLDVQIATARSKKDENEVKKLTEEQDSKKILKTTLEQQELGEEANILDKNTSKKKIININVGGGTQELNDEDKIF